MSKSVKKQVEESKETKNPHLELVDRGISKLIDISGLFMLEHLVRLTMSHNKIDGTVCDSHVTITPSKNDVLPAHIAELKNLETLNLFNNHIEELPTNLSSMPKLRHLNVGMNRLYSLPRGFGSFTKLEVLDLTYNNLNENSLPGNFFFLDSLQALYLSDNDFEVLPDDICKLGKLEILAVRDNDLISLPSTIGELSKLRELHIQGNRMTVLPPELGKLDLYTGRAILKAENNPWVPPIADQFQVGVSHVFDFIRSETYKYLYGRHMQANAAPPPKSNSKSKKTSRREIWGKK